MKTEWDYIAEFERYENNELSAEAKSALEHRLNSDVIFKAHFEEYKKFNALVSETIQTNEVKDTLNSIYNEEFGKTNAINFQPNQTKWKGYAKTTLVAASVCVLFSTVGFVALKSNGYLSNTSSELTELKKKINSLEVSDAKKNRKNGKTIAYKGNFLGTAFLMNNQGYLITDFHIVNNADSIYLENENSEPLKATVVAGDKESDIALLKIDNMDAIAKVRVPYAFKSNEADLGEKIYTLGYPGNSVVYGEGSVSALSGNRGDTTLYQISIPINPGNSGSPLIDEKGNVIGIVKGKNMGYDAQGFAVKTHVIKAIADSLVKNNKELAINLSSKNNIRSLSRTEQIKQIKNCVFMVKVFKKD